MNKERLLNTFLDLVKIYSPSKNEINVMKYITEKLEKLGVKYILHDHSAEYGGNTPVIIAKLEKNCDDEKLNPISLSAHMDVVEPSKDLDVYVEDGLVKTRTKTTLGGDDKGGVAIILETFENLVENNLPHNDVFAVITPSEEIGLLGAKSIKWEEIPSEFMPAKDMLVLDNGGGSDLVAVEGPCMYKINVHYEGASAHAGIEPEKGRSAIIAMSSAISKMKIGRLNDHTTSNIGSIVSEFPTNVVPKDCKIRMEVRCLNEDEAKENVDNYIDIFEKTAKDFEVKCNIEVKYDYPPLKQIDENNLLNRVLDAYKKVGIIAKPIKIGGGCDGNIYLKNGFHSVILGVGMYKIHTIEEYLVISDMEKTAEAVMEFITK
ncbi:M20/M25/M40 family metallo-hydrolase [Parvimonas micra]|uniref:M20/M25/M40 family metallo-hydrolase n=1 Tax=Parvimonas micra TaxID=33033 RepID=UPI0022B5E5B2|nr:M20/M25/M40 family metallo-hydrolase [Parvimonas micra]WBB34188.1 M20/M25/M40 family metallo-hydrolase [Parvimonas micra]WBB35709.1 M20/M25/M40 family metallo-hydrolase [Parvimonas micra]